MSKNVEVTKTIQASAQAIFEAFLDPEKLGQFMKPMEGVTCEDIAVSPEVGGAYKLTMVVGEARVPIQGRYQDLSRYDKLSFTWNSPHAAGNSMVTLHLKELGEDTQITLIHAGLEKEDEQENHRKGWTLILETLKSIVS